MESVSKLDRGGQRRSKPPEHPGASDRKRFILPCHDDEHLRRTSGFLSFSGVCVMHHDLRDHMIDDIPEICSLLMFARSIC